MLSSGMVLLMLLVALVDVHGELLCTLMRLILGNEYASITDTTDRRERVGSVVANIAMLLPRDAPQVDAGGVL